MLALLEFPSSRPLGKAIRLPLTFRPINQEKMRMKKNWLIVAVCLALALGACKSDATNQSGAAGAGGNTQPTPAATAGTAQTEAPSPSGPNTPVKFPFSDFPAVETTAKAGEYVLCPSFNWIKDGSEKDIKDVTFIWYSQKLLAPDKEMSEVQFIGEKQKVPNAYIVPIPAGQRAKKGDIVLTWWQSGSGMNRAIVVDDADPTQPVVRYLDIEYDNPAKSRDGKTTIGQMDEKLKPDSFVRLSAPFEPGTATAIQDGAELKHGIVIREAGDKVFVKMIVGKVGVFDKSKCQPVPVVPSVKAGDKVKAERYGRFAPATVARVDARIGRVFVKHDGAPDSKESAVAFGDVMK
jgi:hypothetical protein